MYAKLTNIYFHADRLPALSQKRLPFLFLDGERGWRVTEMCKFCKASAGGIEPATSRTDVASFTAELSVAQHVELLQYRLHFRGVGAMPQLRQGHFSCFLQVVGYYARRLI